MSPRRLGLGAVGVGTTDGHSPPLAPRLRSATDRVQRHAVRSVPRRLSGTAGGCRIDPTAPASRCITLCDRRGINGALALWLLTSGWGRRRRIGQQADDSSQLLLLAGRSRSLLERIRSIDVKRRHRAVLGNACCALAFHQSRHAGTLAYRTDRSSPKIQLEVLTRPGGSNDD
jgi:hypothetical protein